MASTGLWDIAIIGVLIGGVFLLLPHLKQSAQIGAVQTDIAGGGQADASDTGGSVQAGGGSGNVSVGDGTARAGGGGTTATAGSGARACAGGVCVSAYGDMRMGLSNVI